MNTNTSSLENELKKGQESSLKTSKVTFKESLMGACTNIMYKLGAIGGLKRIPKLLKTNQAHQGIVILGEQISDKMIAKQRLSRLIWFTYREKLKIAEDINSDVGWGCLPRVGQMVLAQALVKHFISNGECLDQKQYFRIIEPFLDSAEENANYSLSMLLKYARWKYAISPGDWFNIGQLSEVLRKIQEEVPLEGSEKLKVVFFSQSVIFLSSIMEKANMKACKCHNNEILCSVCNSNEEKQKDEQLLPEEEDLKRSKSDKTGESLMEMSEFNSVFIQIEADEKKELGEKVEVEQIKELKEGDWEVYDVVDEECLSEGNSKYPTSELDNHLLVIISVRVAEKNVDELDFNSIIALLNLPTSLGIIGGVPSKALYLVGSEGDELIYLDPHYVQEHVDCNNYKENLHTFFSTEYRTINKEALDPSMALCFYFRTIQDVQDLLFLIENLKQLYHKQNREFYVSVMEKDIFEEEIKSAYQNCGIESPNEKNIASCEYSSLEFRDITDSL